MKTLRVGAVVALLFVWSIPADATVIIYKGAAKILRGDEVSGKVVSTELFFVVDFNTLVGSFVFAQNIGGLKTIYSGGFFDYGIVEVPTKPKPTVLFATAESSFVSPNNFLVRESRLRGFKEKVFLTANAPLPATIPKVFSGSYSLTSNIPLAVDGNFTLKVQLKRTHFSNANNLTVGGAVVGIIDEYISIKGYTNAVPIVR